MSIPQLSCKFSLHGFVGEKDVRFFKDNRAFPRQHQCFCLNHTFGTFASLNCFYFCFVLLLVLYSWIACIIGKMKVSHSYGILIIRNGARCMQF